MSDPEKPLDEFERIEKFFKPLAQSFAGSLYLNDDAALLTCPDDSALVVTTDAMVEATHYLQNDAPEIVAARLLRSNLSDLTAMGAKPYAYTLSFALSDRHNEEWLARFTAQLKNDQDVYGINLAGGDSTKAKQGSFFSITAFGIVKKGHALTRNIKTETTEEKTVFVTGTIGDSYLGLQIRLGALATNNITQAEKEFLIKRHCYPQPPCEFAQHLYPYAQAALDISDGLLADTGHLAKASGLSIKLDAEKIPFSSAAKKMLAADPELLLPILAGGEDYELAFIANKNATDAVFECAKKFNVKLTAIGSAEKSHKPEVILLGENKKAIPYSRAGYIHF